MIQDVLTRFEQYNKEMSPLGDAMDGTKLQAQLQQYKRIRITGNYILPTDIVLYEGMTLLIDQTVISMAGNIALRGGELHISNSRLVRTSNSHRAGINVHQCGSRVLIENSVIDCAYYGMFLRAEDGVVSVADSTIVRTTKGAAIRFWGERIHVIRCHFRDCYSAESGGALMLRGGQGVVCDNVFEQCEAERGAAIYLSCDIDVTHCTYHECVPKDMPFVRHWRVGGCIDKKGIRVQKERKISQCTAILDCSLEVATGAKLTISDSVIYMNQPIVCHGSLEMHNVKMICGQCEQGDLIRLDHAASAVLQHCLFDGRNRVGILRATGTRVKIAQCFFANTKGGRAVYNAYASEILDSTFSYCQGGALYMQGGKVIRCKFVGCRDTRGAAVWMYGATAGLIQDCHFERCVSDPRSDVIEKGLAHRVM